MSAAARNALTALAAAVFIWSAASAQSVTIPDDRGRTVRLDAPAQRIVTLSPHLTELVFAAGAGSRLVGVPLFSDYPDAARAVPNIGDSTRVDTERVLSLRPDLVLAWKSGNAAADVARLERLGLIVYVSEAERLHDVARALRAVGRLAGTAAAAEREAAAFERDIARLKAHHADRAELRVFYPIWHRPLLTVSGRHVISDVLAVCGGVNVFHDAALLTPSISLEALLAARPQVVLGGSSAVTPDDFVAQWRRQPVSDLKQLPVKYVSPDLMQRATPRLAQGVAAVCAALDEVRAGR